MGGCISIHGLDRDRISSEIVLQTTGETARYHGTTERNRFQVFVSFVFYLNNLLLLIDRPWVMLN